MSRIVLPGDKLADTQLRIENALLEGGKTYATVIGLFDEAKGTFIPLENVWYPKPEDEIIGLVEESRNGVYTVSMNSPFKGLIISKFGSGPDLDNGDIVNAVIRSVKRESDKIILILVRPRKLYGGKVIMAKPSKVPRIIGKANTMIQLLADKTKSNIVVGMNGMIWLKGGNAPLAISAIRKIEAEAHISGLTERITQMLSKESQ
jgi:exosome complex component RRP4